MLAGHVLKLPNESTNLTNEIPYNYVMELWVCLLLTTTRSTQDSNH